MTARSTPFRLPPLPIAWDDFLAGLQNWRSMSDADLATLREYAEREQAYWTKHEEHWLIAHYSAVLEGCELETQRRATLERVKHTASARFDADFVLKVKESVPLYEYVTYCGTPLKRSGTDRYVGQCPFHTEHTPSFSVWEDHYHCFGCGTSGDLFTFIEDQTGDRNFVHAVEEAARYAGIPLPIPESKRIRPVDLDS